MSTKGMLFFSSVFALILLHIYLHFTNEAYTKNPNIVQIQ